MLAKDRQREISAMVVRTGSVRVDHLSELFSVSQETIRRDLAQLEKSGRLKRSHGGAVCIDNSDFTLTFSEREIRNINEKLAIAQFAIQFIEQGDTIILDASTTAWQMAKLLPDMPLTVLTTSVKIIIALSHCQNIQIIATGGEFSQPHMAFKGSQAEEIIMNHHVDKLFMSCSGCDLNYGISEANESQSKLKREMIKAADQRFLLVDNSKIGVKDFMKIDDINVFDWFVTDKQLPEEYVATLLEKNINLKITNEEL